MAIKILCAGAYNMNSAGDDAPLLTIKELLKHKCSEEIEWHVLSRYESELFAKHYGVYTHGNIEYETKEQSLGKWFRGFNFDDDENILMGLNNLIQSMDLVILGAGNFLNENSFGLFRGMLSNFCIYAFMAKAAKVPCMLYGLSATEIKSPLGRFMTNWLLSQVDAITFREKPSVEILINSGVQIPKNHFILPDPVLWNYEVDQTKKETILLKEGIPQNIVRPLLGIAIREFKYKSTEFHSDFLKRIATVVDKWIVENNGSVLFIPQYSDPRDAMRIDVQTAFDVLSLVKNANNCYVIKNNYWSEEIESLYSLCDVVLGIRLHGSVFSLKNGIPTIGLSYEPKVQGMFESLGLDEYILTLDAHPEHIYEKLKDCIISFNRNEVIARIEMLNKKIEKYGDLAYELLKGCAT